MRIHALRHIVHRLAVGLLGRCPHCERGRLFAGRFRMCETCAYCDVRFARARGEMLGATYVNTTLTLALALAGFFAGEALFHPALVVQIVVWTAFFVLFPVLAFRPMRGLWVAVAYLTGGVYADPDYEREWTNPDRKHVLSRRQPWAGD